MASEKEIKLTSKTTISSKRFFLEILEVMLGLRTCGAVSVSAGGSRGSSGRSQTLDGRRLDVVSIGLTTPIKYKKKIEKEIEREERERERET